jgi:hypothetical protein
MIDQRNTHCGLEKMTQGNILAKTNAVSEVIGASLLVVIAVVAGALIYNYVLPVKIQSTEPNVHLMGYVTEDGNVKIEHVGGEPLDDYEVYVDWECVYINSGDESLEIGDTIPSNISPVLVDENDYVDVMVYANNDDGTKSVVFNGRLFGLKIQEPIPEVPPLIHPMLISSLRTDTIDEDLICYNDNINPQINALTYIYNWVVNDISFAELLIPFDTQNDSIVKDYSDNNNNGTIIDAVWTNEGVVGGAYYFPGSSEYISFDLPAPFYNIPENDFTVMLWLKSSNVNDEWRSAIEIRYDTKNFVRLFQQGNEIHFGVSDAGIKRAVRTDGFTGNTWYHISCVWDASEKSLSIYSNGVNPDKTGNRNYANGAHMGMDLGHGTASSRFWCGYVDELQIYGYALSPNQIKQMYLESKDGLSDERVVVSDMTASGDSWQVVVTPNDGIQDGTPVLSNILHIGNYGGGE